MEVTTVITREEIVVAVRAHIRETFLFGEEDERLACEASFLETGLIDSTGILELIAFIEERYGVTVEEFEMLPENLDSLHNVSVYLHRKLSGTNE